MLLFAARGGELASRIGPRLPMTVGPARVRASASLLLAGVGAGSTYWTGILPGITVFGLGLTLLVAPLTATVLAAAPDRYAGVASGVNNAVARAGSLLAVAALPAVVGPQRRGLRECPRRSRPPTGRRCCICAGLLAAGGVVSWLLIRNPAPAARAVARAGGRCRRGTRAHGIRRSVPAGWSCAGSEGCPGTSHDHDVTDAHP